jgi:hypothetical protein
MNVDDVRFPLLHQPSKCADAGEVESVAHADADEVDVVLARLGLEHLAGPADDGHLVPALVQSGRGLEHLVHRAGVELIELESLKNAHAPRS